MSIRHPLRKPSNENWGRYGKILLREDLARKASVACAILWNFWVLATYLFFYFCLVYCTIAMLKGYGRFLEQPHILPKAFRK